MCRDGADGEFIEKECHDTVILEKGRVLCAKSQSVWIGDSGGAGGGDGETAATTE